MADKTIIPAANVPLVDSNGMITRPYRRWLDEIDVILGSGRNAVTSTVNRDLFDSTSHHSFYGELKKELGDIRKELAFCDVAPALSNINDRLKKLEMALLMIKPHDSEIAELEMKIKALENDEVFSS